MTVREGQTPNEVSSRMILIRIATRVALASLIALLAAPAPLVSAEPISTDLKNFSSTIDKQQRLHLQLTAEINAPERKVFEALSNPEKVAPYDPRITDAKVVSQSADSKVVRITGQAIPIPNAPKSLDVKVTAEPSGDTVHSQSVGQTLVQFHSDYKLKPADDGKGTLVHFDSVSTDASKALGFQVPMEMRRQVAIQSFMDQMNAVGRYIEKAGK
jgi:uncharacterized protein YndB with AHSA1/START domain